VFRGANLGARYEWGALHLAESHFPLPGKKENEFKLIVAKINAHVSKDPARHYGEMQRYQTPSYYCGALRSLLEGRPAPAVDELRHTFKAEGKDRLAVIRNEIDPKFQMLAVAIVNAQLQARNAVLEIQDHKPTGPSVFLVVPCVTLNRPDIDNELVCGVCMADRRPGGVIAYSGLGDDPANYTFEHEGTSLRVDSKEDVSKTDPGDHRELIRLVWRQRKPDEPEALREVRRKGSLTREALKLAVAALANVAPVPAALLLFGEGLVGIHNVWRAHRLAQQAEEHEDARRILREFERRLEELPEERIREVLAALHEEYET
jgi:hypothetical protein